MSPSTSLILARCTDDLIGYCCLQGHGHGRAKACEAVGAFRHGDVAKHSSSPLEGLSAPTATVIQNHWNEARPRIPLVLHLLAAHQAMRGVPDSTVYDGALEARHVDVRRVTLNGPVEDRKSTRLNSSHSQQSRMPSSA